MGRTVREIFRGRSRPNNVRNNRLNSITSVLQVFSRIAIWQYALILLTLVGLAALLCVAMFVLQVGQGAAGMAMEIKTVPPQSEAILNKMVYRISINRNLANNEFFVAEGKLCNRKYAIGLAFTTEMTKELQILEVSFRDPSTQALLQSWKVPVQDLRETFRLSGHVSREEGRKVSLNFTQSQKELGFSYLPQYVRLTTDHSIVGRYYPPIADLINYREPQWYGVRTYLQILAALVFAVFIVLPAMACLHILLHHRAETLQGQRILQSIFRGRWGALSSFRPPLDFPLAGLFALLWLGSLPVVFSGGVADIANAWLGGWWAENFAHYGFLRGYIEAGDNIPPLAFWLLGLLQRISGGTYGKLYILYKASLLLFASTVCAQIFFLARKQTQQCATPWFLAIITYISLILPIREGYQDIYYMPFLLASFQALGKNRFLCASVFLFLAMSWKWQPLILLPFYLLYLLNTLYLHGLLRSWYRSSLTWEAVLPILFGFLAFTGILGVAYPFNLLKVFMRHGELNYGALNLAWLALAGESSQMVWVKLGKFFFILILFFLVLNFLFCNKNSLYKKQDHHVKYFIEHSLLWVLAYFLFRTGVHQNHLLLAFPLLWFLLVLGVGQQRSCLPFALFWLLYQNINLWYLDHKTYLWPYIFLIVLGILYFLGYFCSRLGETRLGKSRVEIT